MNRAICWMSPAFSASRTKPNQKVMAPQSGSATSMTADLAALSAPWLVAANCPVIPATNTPTSKRPSQIRFSMERSVFGDVLKIQPFPRPGHKVNDSCRMAGILRSSNSP